MTDTCKSMCQHHELNSNYISCLSFLLSSIAMSHALGSYLLMVIYYGLSLYWLKRFQLPYYHM